MSFGLHRGSFRGLGAWSVAQNDEASTRLGALEDRLGVKHDEIVAAEAGGYPPSQIEAAFAAHDDLGSLIDQISAEYLVAYDTGTPGSWQSFNNHLADVEARVAAFNPIPSSTASARTGLVVGATIGALAVAGVFVGLIWFATAKRRR